MKTIWSCDTRILLFALSLQAEFTEDDYAIAKCNMPRENTVLAVYLIGIILSLLFISMATVLKLTRKIFKKKTK